MDADPALNIPEESNPGPAPEVAASSSTSSGWGSSWGFSSFIDVLKEKSTSALEVLSHDLSEFTDTVQKDVATAAAAVEEKVAPMLPLHKETPAAGPERSAGEDDEDEDEESEESSQGFTSSSFPFIPNVNVDLSAIESHFGVLESHLHTVKQSAAELLEQTVHYFDNPEDSSAATAAEPASSSYALKLQALQGDRATYLTEPLDSTGFEAWKAANTDTSEDRVYLLATAPLVAKLFGDLVPGEVDEQTFWQRYSFKVKQLHDAEDRHKSLIEDNEEEIRWDEDDTDNSETQPQPAAQEDISAPAAPDATSSAKPSDMAAPTTSVQGASTLLTEEHSEASLPSSKPVETHTEQQSAGQEAAAVTSRSDSSDDWGFVASPVAPAAGAGDSVQTPTAQGPQRSSSGHKDEDWSSWD